MSKIARELSSSNKEASRALPDSKGSETPKQLQTYRTEIYTYFTRATGDTDLLYSAENWVRIKLTLETAGPVSIGTAATLEPVLSGRGRLLDTDREYETYLPKGSRLYIVSETVNRIGVTIEPVPWLEQIAGEQVHASVVVASAISRMGQMVVDAIATIRSSSASSSSVKSASGLTADTLPPCPPRGAIPRARLTPIIGPKRMR